jgi:hypothetical protein
LINCFPLGVLSLSALRAASLFFRLRGALPAQPNDKYDEAQQPPNTPSDSFCEAHLITPPKQIELTPDPWRQEVRRFARQSFGIRKQGLTLLDCSAVSSVQDNALWFS